MRTSLLTISCITAVLGLALGLLLESSLRDSRLASASGSIPKEDKNRNGAHGDAKSEENTKPVIKTKAFDRTSDQNLKGPRVSIPIKEIGRIIQNELRFAEFDHLEGRMEKILTLLGATKAERDGLINIIQKAESEILAAEKTHIKLGESTKDSIQLDRRAMREPVEQITSQIKNGIRSTLNAELAEALISNMDWTKYYNIDERPFIEMKVTRNTSGKLRASVENFSMTYYSYNLDSVEFKDDGNPLPAERVFADHQLKDRFTPLLKGMFILPKDE